VPIATALCVVAGRGVDLTIDAGPLLGVTAGVTLLGLLCGALALLVGATTGSRGIALGITSAAAAITYLISSLAPSVHWIHPARYASPFFYAVGDNQLQHGLPLAWAAARPRRASGEWGALAYPVPHTQRLERPLRVCRQACARVCELAPKCHRVRQARCPFSTGTFCNRSVPSGCGAQAFIGFVVKEDQLHC
jgi:hypothetical protein